MSLWYEENVTRIKKTKKCEYISITKILSERYYLENWGENGRLKVH
jgi:hypothetical protein